MATLPQPKMPPILYKFREAPTEEKHKSIFTSHQVWFPTPLDFNDPFDCRIEPSWEGTVAQHIVFFTRVLMNQAGLDYAAAVKRAKQLVATGKHVVTPDRVQAADSLRLDLLATMGVYCLSEERGSILMWGHYSTCHKGFCLGFDTSIPDGLFGRAEQVTYSQDLPVAAMVVDSENDIVRKMLLTKSCDWSYEREWRIIEFDNVPGLITYPPESLVEIIFGLEMDETHKAALRQLARDAGCHSRFFQARKQPGQYALAFDEVHG
jgi:hypothetical protein